MIKTIDRQKSDYFRWFDSGDLQSVSMLDNIVLIALLMPDMKFWLPTREIRIVIKYLKQGYKIPANLTIRLSDMMIDKDTAYTGNESKLLEQSRILYSGVTTNDKKANCHSFKQHGKCLECRACWDSKAKIYYLKH